MSVRVALTLVGLFLGASAVAMAGIDLPVYGYIAASLFGIGQRIAVVAGRIARPVSFLAGPQTIDDIVCCGESENDEVLRASVALLAEIKLPVPEDLSGQGTGGRHPSSAA